MSDPTASNLPLILPLSPLLSSDGANWTNIQFAYFRQPPCDLPERVSSQHIICLNIGKPVQLEQAVDERHEKVESGFGDVKIYPAYLSQQFHWDKEAEFFNLFLSPSFLATVSYNVFGSDCLELIPHLATLFDPLVVQIGFALKTSLEIDGKNSHLYADSLAHALVVHLLSRYSTNSRQIKTVTGSFTQQQWQQIVDYIEANLDRNMSLTQLAEIVRLSPYHFAHLFKKSTNISPHQYLIRCRIERAKQLIVIGNLSLAAIAQTVGFASQGHFTYHFKRLVGVTPKVFWQQAQER
ncbi:MAG: HTH-type transcriptional activator RhaR [Chroococcidiopsis sp. SAG 2025]|uniref:helix-turn-helix transcriptional regulator n=1 Tax=Chroococcidiopsis sp. SAG 2025 TaxID=171389 RepID=UPI002936ECC2|nr:AraC family transcriptional regulator [Chroococcidiopsis sp. SAG 2025]MDV2993808.1 HTH-type transcriptional activator RhaR [Chroococcidiopsis sp. SAG 2025]